MPEEHDHTSVSEMNLGPWLKKIIHAIFYLDGSVPGTLAALMFKPGKLTLAGWRAGGDRQFQPLNLYFAVNILFFFLAPLLSTPQFQVFEFNLQSISRDHPVYQQWIEKRTRDARVSPEIYTERFNMHMKYNKPALVFLVVPLLALFLKLLYIRTNFVKHLIFALHYLSFFLLALLCSLLLFRILTPIGGMLGVTHTSAIAAVLVVSLFLWLAIYTLLSIRRVYRGAWYAILLKSGLLLIGLFIALGLYTQFLFFYVLLILN